MSEKVTTGHSSGFGDIASYKVGIERAKGVNDFVLRDVENERSHGC